MQVYPDKSQFGWDGDDGLGAHLIEEIIKGKKTATCCPKEFYNEQELRDLQAQVGKTVTVVDKEGRPHCNIKMLDAFETMFGNPDPRLVHGEGCGNDSKRFQETHRNVWANLFKEGRRLDDDTVLVVELFALI